MKSFPLLESDLEYRAESSFINGDNHTQGFGYPKRVSREPLEKQRAHAGQSSDGCCWLIIAST